MFVRRRGRDALTPGVELARENGDPNCLKGEVDLDSERGDAATKVGDSGAGLMFAGTSVGQRTCDGLGSNI